MGAHERRGESRVEPDALRPELATGGARLLDAGFGKVNVTPAGEQILQVPFAFTVTHEHKQPLTHQLLPFVRAPYTSLRPSTSAME